MIATEFMPRLDAIEAMHPDARKQLVERLALEMLKPTFSWERRFPKAVPVDIQPYQPPQESTPEFKPVRRPRRTARHGTIGGYSGGCRCDGCRDAKAAYQRANSAKHISEKLAPFKPVR